MPIFNKIFTILFLLVISSQANGQSHCGPTTPTFTVDLTGQPNGFYTSPSVIRADTCCGSTAPDKCIQFLVTLDPAAVGLIFTVCNGAVPPGALYYQVNCGPPHAVGTGICVQPPYPDTITFCKPGNNQNQYCIQSISPPSVVGLSQNCSALMWTYGFDDSTIVWTSIYPGPPGAYNGYLSCASGCDSTYVTPQAGYPAYIDYKVCGTVTNGCNKSFCDTVRVNFPPPIVPAATTTSVTCYGGNDGSATAVIGGGVPAYSYSWLPSGGTGSTGTGLTAGNYTCTVTDAVGCTKTTTVTIVQPPQLVATYTTEPATCSQSNGTGTILPSGGTPSYTYQWLNGQTTQTATGFSPGIYQVTVGDANGCPLTLSIPISNVLPIVTVNSTSVNCNGGFTGSATSNASGGIPPYGYIWSNGQTTSTATGLSAGTYTIATSSSGCVHYDLVTIPEPTALTGTISAQNNVSCNGGANGTATVNYSGGTPGYSYQWTSGQLISSASGLSAGNYTLTVTDAQGCTATKTVSITEPPLLTLSSPVLTNVLCNGGNTGSASITATGGTSPYTYSWNPSGGNSSAAANLSAGNYTSTVTDAKGCTATNTFAITEPPGITNVISADPNICSGQNATITVSSQGAIPGYSYSWSPGSGTASSIAVSPSSTTTYSVTVMDASGCTKVATQLITVYSQPVAAFSASNGCLTDPTVFSDNSAFGGTTWSWNFGEPASGSNNVSTIQNPSHTYGSPGTYTVSLTISNANGCTSTIVHSIIISPLPSVSFTSNTVCFGNTTTFNNSSFITTGNITNWSWNFGDPNSGANNVSNSMNPTHIFTAGGTFNVILTATSDSGCQSNVTVPVKVLPLPVAAFILPHGCSNTSVQFADSSTIATHWLWDFGNLGATDTVKNPIYMYPSQGSYVVTLIVTSAGGCKDTVAHTFSVSPSPVPNFSPDSVCVNSPTSFTDLSVVPGGNVVSWSWNFGDGSPPDTTQNPSHSYSVAGTYSVALTVTGNNGCVTTGIKTVIVFPRPTALFSYVPETCIDWKHGRIYRPFGFKHHKLVLVFWG